MPAGWNAIHESGCRRGRDLVARRFTVVGACKVVLLNDEFAPALMIVWPVVNRGAVFSSALNMRSGRASEQKGHGKQRDVHLHFSPVGESFEFPVHILIAVMTLRVSRNRVSN